MPPIPLAIPLLALYIHIPWCIRKCPYCDFNSHQKREDVLPETAYINALIDDLEQDIARQAPLRPLTSIFFGGGTPSLFSPESIEKILSAVKTRIPYENPDIEITLEANPGTFERGKFEEFHSAGINRLSIGVQSFQNDKLSALGRIHDKHAAIQAAETAHTAGFTSFNLDLMYGLPNQTLNDALSDIQTALSLAPPHLSWYQLTLEPNTLFYNQPPPLPPDDALADMQERCQALLADAGLQQYEVSAYSKPGHQCEHNLNYWEFGDYLGIGAGAHGKITETRSNKISRITRTHKTKHPKNYLDSTQPYLASPEGTSVIVANELPFEFMLNALRLYKPIPLSLFETRTGLNAEVIEENLQRAKEKGLLHDDKLFIHPTELGYRFLNDLIGLFI
jgi:putative oxygen-independent coproporphyrinogen III oxidase